MFELEKFAKHWEHQKEAFNRAKDKREFGLFFDVGTGKSLTALSIMRNYFYENKGPLKTLILCPPIVIENWVREIKKFSQLEEYTLPLQGSQVKRVIDFKDGTQGPFANKFICITNYEALLMKDLFTLFMQWRPEVIVWDELHRLKDIKSKRTKQAILLADQSNYRLGLTGTPILNSPMDLFAQFRVLDLGKTFGKNFFTFRSKFFYDRNAGIPSSKYFPDWRIRTHATEELNKAVSERSMSVKKSECLDLPPYVRKQIFVGMTPLQTKSFNEMKKSLVTYLNDKACVAELAITKALRLQQIVSGHMKMDDGTVTRFEDHPRMLALKELLSDLSPNHKIIVWSVFKENYADIRKVCEELKIKYVEINGEISSKERNLAVTSFNEDPEIRVCSGHPGSGGIGISLIASDVTIFYSRSFSLEYDIQAEARNYRGGSERHQKVTRIDLITPGTIDEQVVQSLTNKTAIGEKILREMVLE